MTAAKTSLDIYLIAIGGTGMAPLACLLQESGHRVRGADGPLYPPMSTLLEEAGIEPHVGFAAEHLDPAPDLVVVGNAVPRHNVEAEAMEELGLPRMSMPEALASFFLDRRRPLVVAGTHGKTTTSAMLAFLYECCGRDPGYLVGGAPLDLPTSFRCGRGDRFIVEGDEYNAAYFDREAKFLHYRPETLILTSVEYDHADLYPSPEALLDAYRKLIRGMPEEGLLVACGDSREVLDLLDAAPCRVITYGLEPHNELHPRSLEISPSGTRMAVVERGAAEEVELELALWGEHNASNALAAWGVARADGLETEALRRALATFRGVRRRLEEVGRRRDVVVIDDFAHHPTAVGKSLDALRRRFPERRIVALFEPRSLTAGRRLFFDDYVEAFSAADRVLFAPIFHHGRLSDEERLDLELLCRSLDDRRTPAEACPSLEQLCATALAESRAGDVLVTMSSGAFGDLPRRLLDGLEAGG